MLDLETTSVDPWEARIVEAALLIVLDGRYDWSREVVHGQEKSSL